LKLDACCLLLEALAKGYGGPAHLLISRLAGDQSSNAHALF